jgi:hypothetical protein
MAGRIETRREERLAGASAQLHVAVVGAWWPEVAAIRKWRLKREQFARWYSANREHCREYGRLRHLAQKKGASPALSPDSRHRG